MPKKKPVSFLDFSEYKAFWQKDGDSIIEHLQKQGVDVHAMRTFNAEYGAMQLAVLDKLIMSRLKEYENMKDKNPLELAYLGHDLLLEFYKQVEVEIYAQAKESSQEKTLQEDE